MQLRRSLIVYSELKRRQKERAKLEAKAKKAAEAPAAPAATKKVAEGPSAAETESELTAAVSGLDMQ